MLVRSEILRRGDILWEELDEIMGHKLRDTSLTLEEQLELWTRALELQESLGFGFYDNAEASREVIQRLRRQMSDRISD